jgi:phosphoserine phosphatase RsbU/P
MEETGVTDLHIKKEFYRSTEKFHVIACWVGLLLNLVWFVSDYFVQPAYFTPFLLFRLGVSLISALSVIFRKRLGLDIYQCMFIVVLGISIQNAFMWSVMDVDNFQQHTFAYMVLFIGAGMLVLWELRYSLVLLALTIIANVVFYELNSRLSLEEFLINGGLLTLTVLVFCLFLIRTRYRLTYSEIRNRMYLEHSKVLIEQKHTEVVRQKVEIQEQRDAIEIKNREITDSIHYARTIQRSTIPTEESFASHFKSAFVLFRPKDIVSGDFYWIHETDDRIFYATADCTGHGVPGGFMTMLGLSFLDEIIGGKQITDPAEVLDLLRERIISTLNQKGEIGENKDGMDITVCCIDKASGKLVFASANNDLYVIRQLEDGPDLAEYKANRQPCGFHHVNSPFTAHTIQLQPGDKIYTFTDGYADQFGGPNGKKFRFKNLEDLLTEISPLEMTVQKDLLQQAMADWQQDYEQVDDMLIIGIEY